MPKKRNITIKYAYELDELLDPLKQFRGADVFADKIILQCLNKIRSLNQQIQPAQEDEYDKTWSYWIPIPTGSFERYLKLVAKEEDTPIEELREELLFMWEDNYPEKDKWYRLNFSVNKRTKEFALGLDKYLIGTENGSLMGYTDFDLQKQYSLLNLIYAKFEIIIQKIIKNHTAYLNSLEKALPKNYRFGRILRSDVWSTIDKKERLDKLLGKESIAEFKKIVPELKKGKPLFSMTANDFFRYCAICYDANQYPQIKDESSPIEKYKIMADMRDEGLTEIKGDSKKAFSDWYNSKRGGGHPWEICRGGNTTHISLYVAKIEDAWKLMLAGSSHVRVVETVRMSLALYKHGIIVQVAEAKELLRMITGEDYIGLVPHDVTPRYCHLFFPEEDQIIDFANPWMMSADDYKKISPHIYWYPLEKYIPAELR
jgi:hypothetical protein